MHPKNLWWILLVKGIVFIIFGILAMGWPAITFVSLASIFALYIILSGLLNIIHGIVGLHAVYRYWFLTVLIGVLEIGAGTFAFRDLRFSVITLVLLIGFVFIIRGIFEAVSAFESFYSTAHKVLLAFNGVLGVIAGFIVLRYPAPASLAFTWVLGAYALIVGAIYIALSVTFVEPGIESKQISRN
jgi:uncharacterized membrane protein HdeD (DUF308 family)